MIDEASTSRRGPVPPGSALGVFGGGQLGMMFVEAARAMGYRTHVYSNRPDSPAGRKADHEHVGALDDLESVAEFARTVDAATLEFENLPEATIAAAERCTIVRPSSRVLRTAQHRFREKQFLQEAGAPVGPFGAIGSEGGLGPAADRTGFPAVLKTAEFGYDGKGQRVVRNAEELAAAWRELGECVCVLEGFVDFRREVSVLVARGLDGQTVEYGPIENSHANHILDVSVLPAPGGGDPEPAKAIARLVAERLDLVGLICVEMFELAGGELLVNEIAPRPHNSGHLTIEGCVTSQFEQQTRALCGLPFGSPASHKPAAMANLLGDLWEGGEPNWPAAEALGVSLHLYGKAEPKRGRKMGHLTALADTPEGASRLATAARDALRRGL